jgi:hypothetical protein
MTVTVQPIDYSVDLLKAVLWQYDSSTNLQAILQAKQAWYNQNQRDFWIDWQRDVFDLRTANNFGLAIWSIILGMPIYLTAPSGSTQTWGFNTYHANFNRGNFGKGSNSTIQLSTADARTLLQLRAFQIQSCGCVPEINRELAFIFGIDSVTPGAPAAYVIDNNDMTCTYVFNFSLTSSLQYVMQYFDVLPRPSGVKSTLVINLTGTLITEDGTGVYVTEGGAFTPYTTEDGLTNYTNESGSTNYTTESGITGTYVTDHTIIGTI